MHRKTAIRRHARTALIALAAVLPASSLAAPQADDRSGQTDFSDHFQTFVAQPTDYEQAPHAVDITAIEPAIEAQVEPATRSLGRGVASYYGRKFQGRRTASGERFDMNGLTAAHKTLPFGSLVRVTNPRSGKSVTVRINDRGPFVRGRAIDLSRRAADEIGIIARGHGEVELELIDG